MSEEDLKGMGERLRSAMRPVEDAELRRDLWPAMLRRLDAQGGRLSWFDWVLLAGLGAAVVFFPAVVPALLYQF
jgi:hypothetical protein